MAEAGILHFRSLRLALLVALLAVPVASAESATYVAPGGDHIIDAQVHCPPAPASDTCVGGATFAVPETASAAEIVVDDAVVPSPASFAIARGADGAYLGDQAFCGSTAVSLPQQTASLTVHVLSAGPPLGIWGTGCPLSPGTAGTIQVGWS